MKSQKKNGSPEIHIRDEEKSLRPHTFSRKIAEKKETL